MNEYLKVTVKEIKEEAAGTRSFFFDIPEGMTWTAGTDLHFAHPDFDMTGTPDKTLVRHMSVVTIPEEGRLGFTTRVPGSGSLYKRRLESLSPGDEMVMFKPGNRFPLRREDRPVVFISMGVGAAAIRPMIKSWLLDPKGLPSMTNLIVDKKDRFVFRREFESAAASLKNLFSEDRNAFYRNLESLPYGDNPIFYIVGSDGFLEDVIDQLKRNGVEPESIELDKKPDKKALMLRP